jgi:aminoglycoside phosphotransferase (APT) family kinase protein
MALVNSVDPVAATPALAATLTRHLEGIAGAEVSDVHVPAGAGLPAETVMFTASWRSGGEEVRRELVARVGPQGPGLFHSYDLELEARVMAAVGAAGVPVPEVLLVEPDASVLGAPFLVMPRIAGRTLSDDPPFTAAGWLVESSPEQQRLALENAPDALLGAHIAHWEKAFAWASEGRPNPYVEAGFAWVKENRPTGPEPVALSWGDARISNIIFADDLSVNAVIDWEVCCLGNPELDLGWWFATLRLFSDAIGIPLPPGSHRARTQFEHLHFYEAFAYLRLAVCMIRGARLLIAGGVLPPEAGMEFNNPATRLLAELTGGPMPTEDSAYFIGNR